MEAVILSKSDVEGIKDSIEEMKEYLKSITSPAEYFISTEEFNKLMGISPIIAQVWRNEGRIGYSQKGEMIYYRMSDVERFLRENYQPPKQIDP